MAQTGRPQSDTAPALAAAHVFERASGVSRRRAPKQEGRRAQLTIPASVWTRAEELARVLGTTPNDVLAVFAAKGMVVADRQLATARIAADRVAAYRAGAVDEGNAELPPAEELEEAARALRRELDSP